MRGLLAVLLCTTLAAAPLALSQEKAKKAPTEAQKKQQERMSACNKEANEKKLKGDERKKFVNTCLKGQSQSQAKAPSAKQKAQQDKMGDCNKQANLKNMKGEDRKTFMSSCLKG
jgi:psiF repeat